MNINFTKKKDRSGLVKFVRDNIDDIDKLPDSFKNYFNEENIKTIPIDKWIDLYQVNNNIITIDLRSESEFREDKLPNSINFPILDDNGELTAFTHIITRNATVETSPVETSTASQDGLREGASLGSRRVA